MPPDIAANPVLAVFVTVLYLVATPIIAFWCVKLCVRALIDDIREARIYFAERRAKRAIGALADAAMSRMDDFEAAQRNEQAKVTESTQITWPRRAWQPEIDDDYER